MALNTRLTGTTMGDRLRELRSLRHYSQTRLATRLGASQSLISEWEGDRKTPSLAQLKRLARALDVPILHLLQGQAQPGDDALLSELRWYGLDVHGDPGKDLWLVRPPEEVLVSALATPSPRVIDRLAGLFFLQPGMSADLLVALARQRSVEQRLGWLRDVALALTSRGIGQRTRALIDIHLEPRDTDHLDDLGHPAEDSAELPGIWKRWRVDYGTDLDGIAAVLS